MFANKFGEHLNVCCGLVTLVEDDWKRPKQTPIPLISVNVEALIAHAVAQVEVTQVYENKEKQPIEAIYYFPVNPEGAVTHFRAELEGRVIKGLVKPQDEAKKDYDKAVGEKKTALLGEETKADIFKVRVGFLKPGAQVKVIIGYVTEVKNEPGSNAIGFYIPTTIAPRYVSDKETDDKAKDIKNMEFSKTSPAPLSIKVDVSLQGGIKSIQSPTHTVKVEKSGPIPENKIWHNAIVELAGTTTDMDRDFVLNIEPEEVSKPRIYSEKIESGSTALMVHLVPSFKLGEQKTELIFVLDRSGSMMGESIELAKKALLIFLHSMPADCYFNVVGFGSRFEFLFPASSVKYDDGTLKAAVAHAKNLHADLGGTEILEPLKALYGKPGIDGYLRQIFILTDGEVSNTDGVLGIAQANAHKARVFALGIGGGASHHLVEGVAKAGGGTSAFVTYNESIDKKVLNQLKNGLQPSLTDIELEWEGLAEGPVVDVANVEINKEKTLLGYGKPTSDSLNAEVESVQKYRQSPKRIPPVYDGSQLLVFGLFQDECPKSVLIKAQSPDGALTLKIEHSSANYMGNSGMLHRLAAIKLIRELELDISALRFQGQGLGLGDVSQEEEKLKKEIVEISCRNGISSRYTSFVAVDEGDKASEEHWVMETRNVPSQLAHGWQCNRVYGSSLPGIGGSSFSPACGGACGGGYSDDDDDIGIGFPAANVDPFGGCEKKKRKAPPMSDPASKKIAKPPPIASKSRAKAKGKVLSVPTNKSSRESSNAMKWEASDAKPETETSLLTLTNLQSFNGSYALDKKLADILGKPLKELITGAGKHTLTKEVFATALAISFFETKLADERDVWELMVVKAKKWMAKEIGGAETVDAIIQTAATFLGN